MNLHDDRQAAAEGGATAAELAWLADRFVLGELDASQTALAEALLVEDDAFAEAVARSSRIILSLVAAGGTTSAPPAGPRIRVGTSTGRRRLPAGVVAGLAACLALAAWIAAPRPAAPPEPRDMVHIWRQVAEADWQAGESGEEAADEPDVVPHWMSVAIALDAAEPRILEN
jgi:hypothetical protein